MFSQQNQYGIFRSTEDGNYWKNVTQQDEPVKFWIYDCELNC